MSLSPFLVNVGHIVHQNIGYKREYTFDVPFQYFDPGLELRDIRGSAEFTRASRSLLMQLELQASVLMECVRCLEVFKQDISFETTELYAFNLEDVDEFGLLLPESGKINLEPLIREEMFLAVPLKSVCREDCLGLCPVCGENRNVRVCDHEQEKIDPRLEELRSILHSDQGIE